MFSSLSRGKKTFEYCVVRGFSRNLACFLTHSHRVGAEEYRQRHRKSDMKIVRRYRFNANFERKFSSIDPWYTDGKLAWQSPLLWWKLEVLGTS
jgi:hypothetical protein